jgi:hypothetical protein
MSKIAISLLLLQGAVFSRLAVADVQAGRILYAPYIMNPQEKSASVSGDHSLGPVSDKPARGPLLCHQ